MFLLLVNNQYLVYKTVEINIFRFKIYSKNKKITHLTSINSFLYSKYDQDNDKQHNKFGHKHYLKFMMRGSTEN